MTRTPIEAAQGHLQSRGRHYDIIREAIAAYDEYMLDDDYDAQGALDKIIKKMRERLDMAAAPAAPVETDDKPDMCPTCGINRNSPFPCEHPRLTAAFELTPFMVKLLKRACSDGWIALADDMSLRYAETATMQEMAKHDFVRSAREIVIVPGPPQPPGWVITDKGREAASSALTGASHEQ